MSDESRSTPGLSPSRVLASLVEPWLKGKRVALIGEASLGESQGLAEALAERGARFVQVLDPRQGQQHRVTVEPSLAGRVSIGPYGPEALAQPPREAFDLALIVDLGMFDDPRGECARARRLVVPGGLLLAAASNGEAKTRLMKPREGRKVDYYELYDSLAPLFRNVRTFGQAPFVGYALADFGAGGEPEVSVDASLLATPEEPEWFVAIASDRGLAEAAEFSIVALPTAGLRTATQGRGSEAGVALAEAQARIAAQTSQLEAARDRERVKVRELEQRSAELGATAAQLEEARRDARGAKFEERASRAEAERDRLKKRLEDAERELSRVFEELEHLGNRKLALEVSVKDGVEARAELEATLSTERAERVAALTREAAREKAALAATRLEKEALTAVRAEKEALSAKVAALEAELQRFRAARAPTQADLDSERARDVATLEEALRERGRAVARQAIELRESERFARELLLELEEARAITSASGDGHGGGGGGRKGSGDELVPAAELAARLDALAAEAARREADYHAASWRVRTLERDLAELRGRSEASSRAASEQAVLLAQVAGAALAEAP